jgi:predicted RNA-binding Zn ribbon-like protein
VRRVYHEFKAADLVGGDLALDFVNTVTARDTEPSDFLDDYHALIRWARLTSGFGHKDLVELTNLACSQPEKAAAALGRCRRVREALCAVLYALIARREPQAENVAIMDHARKRAFDAARLNACKLSLRVVWSVERSGLDLITHVVTARALDLLQNVSLDRLRVCTGTDCGWVFIDTSKNGKRRWCDMEVCGNAAKARRFRKRHA